MVFVYVSVRVGSACGGCGVSLGMMLHREVLRRWMRERWMRDWVVGGGRRMKNYPRCYEGTSTEKYNTLFLGRGRSVKEATPAPLCMSIHNPNTYPPPHHRPFSTPSPPCTSTTSHLQPSSYPTNNVSSPHLQPPSTPTTPSCLPHLNQNKHNPLT